MCNCYVEALFECFLSLNKNIFENQKKTSELMRVLPSEDKLMPYQTLIVGPAILFPDEGKLMPYQTLIVGPAILFPNEGKFMPYKTLILGPAILFPDEGNATVLVA